MKFVEWSILFEVGNTEIDRQHRVFFDLANRFYDEFVIERENTGLVFETLKELKRYAQEHFRYEERLLVEHHCPADYLEHHKATHKKLIEEISAIIDNSSGAGINGLVDAGVFLTKWLILHVLIDDKRHAAFFLKK